MKHTLNCLFIALLVIFSPGMGQTSFTATYNLSGNGNNVTTFAYNGTTYDGINPGSLLKVSITSSSSSGNFRGTHWPLGATSGSDSFTGTIDTGYYIGFTIDAVSGYMYTVSEISFGLGRSSTGPRQWEWRGSSDSYSTAINNYSSLNANLVNNSGTLTNPDLDSSWKGNVLDVSSGYTDLTTTASFRLYGFNSEGSSGTGGLQGNLTITGTFTTDHSLPVTLSLWNGASKNGRVLLNWTTDSEIENLGFIIERALTEKGSWNEIASFSTDDALKGRGSTNNTTSYHYTDTAVEVGRTYYYRLSDVNYKGVRTIHKVISVAVSAAGQNAFPGAFRLERIYPNPFNPRMTISFTVTKATPITVKLFDIQGRLVSQLANARYTAGDYNLHWNGLAQQGQPAPSGVYLLRVSDGESALVRKLVLAR